MRYRNILVGTLLLLSLGQQTWAEPPQFPDHDIVVFDLKVKSDSASLSNPQLVTDRVGYDNQPFFDADSQAIFYTRIEGSNADIWRWSPFNRARAWTETELSEYSPTVMPNERGTLSTVVVEKDETQRLWSYSEEFGFELIFQTVKPVGYHAWSGENVALFVLAEPHQLRVGKLGQESTKLVDADIGRCLQKVPERDAVSYTRVEGENHRLKLYDFSTRETSEGRLLPSKVQDYVWLDSQTLITSDGQGLLIGQASKDSPWVSLPFPQGLELSDISRLAISPDKKKLAVVYVKS